MSHVVPTTSAQSAVVLQNWARTLVVPVLRHIVPVTQSRFDVHVAPGSEDPESSQSVNTSVEPAAGDTRTHPWPLGQLLGDGVHWKRQNVSCATVAPLNVF